MSQRKLFVGIAFLFLLEVVTGQTVERFEHDGALRTYLLYAPGSLSGAAAAPLVVDLHGGAHGSSGLTVAQLHLSGFRALADSHGFLVAYPEGLGGGWNTGAPGCEAALTDDVGFLRRVVTHVSAARGVDATRVYFTGHSCGCMMAHRMAANASDIVAAQACFAGYLTEPGASEGTAAKTGPVAVPADAVPAYQATSQMVVVGSDDPFTSGSAQANFQLLAARNGCTAEAALVWQSGSSTQYTYQACAGDSQVSMLTLHEAGHQPYPCCGSPGVDSSSMAWTFLYQFSRAGAALTALQSRSTTASNAPAAKDVTSKTSSGTSPGAAAAATGPVLRVVRPLPVRHLALRPYFHKFVDVFGVHVFATINTQDAHLLHAAQVLAQLLDNTADANVDNKLVLSHMVARKAALVVFPSMAHLAASGYSADPYVMAQYFTQPVVGDAMALSATAWDGTDTATEQALHLILASGYSRAYPDVFGLPPNATAAKSKLAAAMDATIGDCGHAFDGTKASDDLVDSNCTGRFHFDSTACGYTCLVRTYFYLGLTTVYGGLAADSYLCTTRAQFWEICTASDMLAFDPDGYKLLATGTFALPTKMPGNAYRPSADAKQSTGGYPYDAVSVRVRGVAHFFGSHYVRLGNLSHSLMPDTDDLHTAVVSQDGAGNTVYGTERAFHHFARHWRELESVLVTPEPFCPFAVGVYSLGGVNVLDWKLYGAAEGGWLGPDPDPDPFKPKGDHFTSSLQVPGEGYHLLAMSYPRKGEAVFGTLQCNCSGLNGTEVRHFKLLVHVSEYRAHQRLDALWTLFTSAVVTASSSTQAYSDVLFRSLTGEAGAAAATSPLHMRVARNPEHAVPNVVYNKLQTFSATAESQKRVLSYDVKETSTTAASTFQGASRFTSGASSSAAACPVEGSGATYSESIAGSVRYIAASGCPNHYSACVGKAGICTAASDDYYAKSEAQIQDYAVSIPSYPLVSSTTTDLTCTTGDVAIAFNGVAIYSQSAGACGSDAVATEGSTFGVCGGHATPTGAFHYHIVPTCLLLQLGHAAGEHSPMLGWAYDGFPVYGPLDDRGLEIRSCIATCGLPACSSRCLDPCNGHFHPRDGFVYHYHATGPPSANLADVDSPTAVGSPLPSSEYAPYTIGCYRGCTLTEITGGTCISSGNGYTADYAPTATSGTTTQYAYTSA